MSHFDQQGISQPISLACIYDGAPEQVLKIPTENLVIGCPNAQMLE